MTWRNQESGSEAFFGIGFGTWGLGIETGSASEAFSEVFLGMGFS